MLLLALFCPHLAVVQRDCVSFYLLHLSFVYFVVRGNWINSLYKFSIIQASLDNDVSGGFSLKRIKMLQTLLHELTNGLK